MTDELDGPTARDFGMDNDRVLDAVTIEACASVAEHLSAWGNDFGKGGHALHIAAVLRAMPATRSTGANSDHFRHTAKMVLGAVSDLSGS